MPTITASRRHDSDRRSTALAGRVLRRLPFLVLLIWAPASLAQPATPANADVLGDLAAECLLQVPGTARAFVVDAPAEPFARTAVVARWLDAGLEVFEGDADPALPRVYWRVERAGVAYQRAGRGRVTRDVHLALRYRHTAPDGRVLAEAVCERSASDVVPRAALADLDGTLPATRGTPPPAGRLRRWVEPAALVGVAVVTTVLLFSLRGS